MKPWLDDGDLTFYHGDSLEVLRQLPSGVAQTCVTSPPYWGLRDYGTGQWTGGDEACDHIAGKARQDNGERTFDDGAVQSGPLYFSGECGKCGARRVDSQLGLEATPTEYVANMVALFREVRRVLRDDGTLWLNLGDSYVANPSGGMTGSTLTKGGRQTTHSRSARRPPSERTGCDCCDAGGCPECKAGNHHGADGERLKPKDLVGIPWRIAFALQADGWYLRSDIIWAKPNPMPESVTDRPTKAHEYVFLFSKQPRYFYDADAIREPATYFGPNGQPQTGPRAGEFKTRAGMNGEMGGEAGRNRRSVWTIPTEPFPEAHFATYPQALVQPCILAGSPVGSLVLDPFIGSGTSAVVARKHGRRCIGIDLSTEYLEIAAARTRQLSLLGAG